MRVEALVMEDIPPELKQFPDYLSATIVKDAVWSEARFSVPSKMQQTIKAQQEYADPEERARNVSQEQRTWPSTPSCSSNSLCIHSAAREFASRGEYVQALPLFHRAAAGVKETVGEAHTLLADCLCDLAWCLTDMVHRDVSRPVLIASLCGSQGRAQEANTAAHKALGIYNNAYGSG